LRNTFFSAFLIGDRMVPDSLPRLPLWLFKSAQSAQAAAALPPQLPTKPCELKFQPLISSMPGVKLALVT
jgi:hypothetical protein